MFYTIRIFSMFLILGGLAFSGVAFGHGTKKYGKMVPGNEQMKKLHAMMQIFSIASAGMGNALEKGDVVSVETEAEKILAAISELKNSKPHKNVKQRKLYIAYASRLEESVFSTVVLAKKGNFAEAKTAYTKVEETCAACHTKFRD